MSRMRPNAGVGGRREVTPQDVEEVEAIQNADALVTGAQGVDVGIVGDEMSRLPHDGAGHDDIIIGVSRDATRDICGGEGNRSACQKQVAHKPARLTGWDVLGHQLFAILRQANPRSI